MSAYSDALRLLAGRELSVVECRERLIGRDHPVDEVDEAIRRLTEEGTLDDRRVARAHARAAVDVKGRGRHRIARELQARGIDRRVAAEALAEILGNVDERSLVARAIERKLRRRAHSPDAAGAARLYQFLMRQGFSPAAIAAELRRFRRGSGDDQ